MPSLESPLGILLAIAIIIYGIAWIVFPFVAMHRLNQIADRLEMMLRGQHADLRGFIVAPVNDTTVAEPEASDVPRAAAAPAPSSGRDRKVVTAILVGLILIFIVLILGSL